MANAGLRRVLFFMGVYGALPFALVGSMLVGWMFAVENATIVLQAADSPDGRYRAEVVRTDPGTSSDYEYMVRLMPAGLTSFEKSLRLVPFVPVYVALDLHREPDKLAVAWSSADEIAIECQGCGQVRAGKTRWRGVALKYELR